MKTLKRMRILKIYPTNKIRTHFLKEPELQFGFNQCNIDPRDGLMLFGPFEQDKHSGQITVGIIGPKSQINLLKDYLRKLHSPIGISDSSITRPMFPGLEAVFGIKVNFTAIKEIEIDNEKINEYLAYVDSHTRVYNLVTLYSDPLLHFANEEEVRPHVWFVVIPEDIFKHGRPKSLAKLNSDKKLVTGGLTQSQRKDTESSFLFSELNEKLKPYEYEINFHNQLKARLLGDKIVTQIIRDSKIDYENYFKNPKRIEAERKLDSAKAWNISSTLYYKSGGLPWKLSSVRKGVCYIGIVFKNFPNDKNQNKACCAAQMFLDSGDGMVFRGNIGPWFNPKTKEFHIKKEDAKQLIEKALLSYKQKSENNNYPNELFIHSRTFFDNDEWEGFQEAAKGKSDIIGVRIKDDKNFKLFREFKYAVSRGTLFILNKRKAYLWSRGFIPKLKTQAGLESPNPILVEILKGNADIKTVCRDVLALTKLNYNACNFADGLPVTLRFADNIGEILTAGPDTVTDVLPFKNYI